MKILRTLSLSVTIMAQAPSAGGATATSYPPLPNEEAIDHRVNSLMQEHEIPGLALAIIRPGNPVYLRTYGLRDEEKNLPLTRDTVMYGASITKFVFATYVIQLAHQGLIDMDTSIAELLPKPLPDYDRYQDLRGDSRWKQLTLRILLSHQTGFPNYRFFPPEGGFDPNGKLAFYFEPGERYGYSGEGYYIAQLVVEEATGLNTELELQKRFFKPLGMTRTSLLWQEHFRSNFAQGYTIDGENQGHNMRSNVRAAGSMDTTIHDVSLWVNAFMAGNLISDVEKMDLLSQQASVHSVSMFPTLTAGVTDRYKTIDLGTSIGSITFSGPQGRAFFKGGHDEKTDNQLLCLTERDICVLALMNTAKGHLVYPALFDFILKDTGMPWPWEYSALNE